MFAARGSWRLPCHERPPNMVTVRRDLDLRCESSFALPAETQLDAVARKSRPDPTGPTAELYATLLGRFAIYREGRQLSLAHRGAVAELSRFMVAHAGRRVPRDELIELVWADADYERAVHRLHVAVSSLRRELDPGRSRGSDRTSPLLLEDETYCLSPEAVV